ncbi:NUDIX domain-containing protein [Oscillospiraceae bacterium MB08-C2-2]|nr:NUDIX domain-containing protein [Oscillospiraceae bacterium MB08-C2-2]
MKVGLHHLDEIDHSLLKYAVVVSEYEGKWIFCKHKERSTWELPAGHREPGEPILETAGRELYEETGALEYKLTPICIYSMTDVTTEYGFLCYASVQKLGPIPPLEMEKIELFDAVPEPLTYPWIQPELFDTVQSFFKNK